MIRQPGEGLFSNCRGLSSRARSAAAWPLAGYETFHHVIDRLLRFIDEVYNPKPNVAAVMAALDPWFEDYNVHRPHTALAGQPPISRLIVNNLLDHDSYRGPLHDRDDAGVGCCSSATPVGVLTTACHNPYNQPYVPRGAANRE